MQPAVKVTNLTKKFAHQVALDGVDHIVGVLDDTGSDSDLAAALALAGG